MDLAYGQAYRELFEKHWWWRARTELIVDALREFRPQQGWKRILDVGCGDGLFFDRLAEFGEVEGVEPSAEVLTPNNRHRSMIYSCPFDQNFQPGKAYSLILMLDVLEHLEDPVSALRYAMDLLTPDGILLITVPAFMSLWTNHDRLNHHFTRYTKRTFGRVADQAGFQIQRERYFYHWTFPVKAGLRTLESLFPWKPEPPKIPSGWINEALFWISRIEQKTLSALPIPFGTSLLAVGGRRKAS